MADCCCAVGVQGGSVPGSMGPVLDLAGEMVAAWLPEVEVRVEGDGDRKGESIGISALELGVAGGASPLVAFREGPRHCIQS